jgi:hypothetical protein
MAEQTPRRGRELPECRSEQGGASMGVRTRGLDIKAGAAKLEADRAVRAEAELVIDRWNRRLATGRDMLWPPTIRAALIAGTPWLDVFCPGCRTSRAIDLRTVDRHPLTSVGTLVLGLRCSWCPGPAPKPKLLGLYALPPANRAREGTANLRGPVLAGVPFSGRNWIPAVAGSGWGPYYNL